MLVANKLILFFSTHLCTLEMLFVIQTEELPVCKANTRVDLIGCGGLFLIYYLSQAMSFTYFLAQRCTESFLYILVIFCFHNVNTPYVLPSGTLLFVQCSVSVYGKNK